MPPKSSKPKRRGRTKISNCPSGELRVIVDKITFGLFIENGYENTTMRMISDQTGFGASSIYNTFDGKEDILADIIVSSYDTIIKNVELLVNSGVSRLDAISLPMCATIYMTSRNRRYAELFNVAFQNWTIYNLIIDKTVSWEHKFLEDFGIDMTLEEMRNALLINGAVVGRFIAQYYAEGPQDCTEGIYWCMREFCWLFGVKIDNEMEVAKGMTKFFEEDATWGFFDMKGIGDEKTGDVVMNTAKRLIR